MVNRKTAEAYHIDTSFYANYPSAVVVWSCFFRQKSNKKIIFYSFVDKPQCPMLALTPEGAHLLRAAARIAARFFPAASSLCTP
jgi:hypothetical protein